MTIRETENSIIKDLEDLGDTLSGSEFLIRCGRAYTGMPKELLSEADLVRDCQVKTWVRIGWNNGCLEFMGNSESMLVAGALSLFDEMFSQRSAEELRGFSCTLVQNPVFESLFTQTQLNGLKSIVKMILVK